MKGLIVSFAASTAVAIGSTALAGSPINGNVSDVENGCVAFVEIFVGTSCSSNESSFLAPGPAGAWGGPIYTGTYYAKGAGPGADNPGGGDPNGAGVAVGPMLIGNIDIDGSGPGATIGGWVKLFGADYAFDGGQGNFGEVSWNQLRYEITPKVADSAASNGIGGHTYVIGSQGLPVRLAKAFGPPLLFPQNPAGSFFGPAQWQRPGVPGVNDTPGLTTYELNDFSMANIGTTASATFSGVSCTDTVGSGACAAGGSFNNDPNLDNLIMQLNTDACGKVVSGIAYSVREFNTFGPPSIDTFSSAVWAFEGSGNPCGKSD